MSELQPINGEQSPFDAIRRVRPDGSEYWSARELMPLMGYARWENFATPMVRAMKTAENQAMDVDQLFLRSQEKTAGRPREDFELARYAAYLVAMNGDPNIPEVAEAQHYFAMRTRQAEVQPALPQTREERLALAVLDAQQMLAEKDELLAIVTTEKKVLAAAIERDAPLVAKAEAHTVSDSAIHRQEFSREVISWGRKQNIDIKQEQVMRFLGHIGLFIRGERTDTGHATADALKRGLAFTDKGTAKNGHAWATGKLTARGQDYAWKRITNYVAEHGTLLLPRELRGGDPA